jgi:hypothetical protein
VDELESPNDKKKTNVTFNELVERIEVITDDDIKPTEQFEDEVINIRF